MFKRLYYDVETSMCEGRFWRPGRNIDISPEQITKEAQIICICYKFEHEKIVHSLDWTDPDMIAKFALVLDDADEVVGHNLKTFDQKWLMWEMLKARIPAFPTYKIVDTLSMMRSKFRAPSNRLNYLCKVLFGKEKSETGGLDLWFSVMDGDTKALAKMVSYCKNDVLLLEELYLLIESYFPPKTNVAVMEGKEKWCCAYCASDDVAHSKERVTTAGMIRQQMYCNTCKHYYTIPDTIYNKFLEEK